MTEPANTLADLAVPYALHALTDQERNAIEIRLASSDADQAGAFYSEVRAAREALAALASVHAVEPPLALRSRVLAATRQRERGPERRWRATLLAAAAVIAIGLGAAGVGIALRPTSAPSTEQQIFAAPDVRTISGDLPSGGTATFVFSRDEHAGVLVMNHVPPPSPGTVYQMWLVEPAGMRSAGTMDSASVSPSTTAVLPELGDSTALNFTVEPGTGSAQPTGKVFASLPLV